MSTPFWPVTFATAPYKQRGIAWDVTKKPNFKTVKQMSVTGREARIAAYSRSLYEFILKYEILIDDGDSLANAALSFPQNELRVVMGFYAARKGAFDPFFFPDPWDKRTVGETLSASTPAINSDPANPTSRNYQLVRTYGGTTEPVGGLNVGVMGEPVPDVYYGATHLVVNTDYVPNAVYDSATASVQSRDGWICLNTAPPGASHLQADFSYFYRVHFDDTIEANTFLKNFWQMKQFTLFECWY